MVVITSDNGPFNKNPILKDDTYELTFFESFGPPRRIKTWIAGGRLRVPTIVTMAWKNNLVAHT